MERRIPSTATDDQQPFLSVVIPAYNEEQRLPSTLDCLHAYLRRQSYAWEIIVASNGSTDDTEGVVREIAASVPNLHLLRLEARGKGVATKAGALRSRGQVLFLCDADLSTPPDALEAFLAALEGADIVVGSREAPGSRRFDEPWHRHLMGRIFNRLVQLLAVPGIQDTQCGFKALRQPIARDLFGRQTLVGFGFDVELLFLARRSGYVIRELPIDWYFNADTRVRPGVDSLHMLGEVLHIRLSEALGHYRARTSSPGTRREDIGR
jgi:dolichyl-phosphate beta-glucosyltransferase